MINDLRSMALSPSFKSILSCLYLFRGDNFGGSVIDKQQEQTRSVFREAYNATIKEILAEPDDEKKVQAVHVVLAALNSNVRGEAGQDANLEQYIVKHFGLAMQGASNDWMLVSQALRHEGSLTF